ncbi:hypothetical protein C8J56DRAFT_1156735 [Mycena floridula]|nr:hypothetical protein C8J56DRAFT_1156735 [Mycena floridula]
MAATVATFYGPVLLGTFEFIALWAVVCVQGFMYFVNPNYKKDSIYVKALVIWLLLSTNVSLGLLITPIYRDLISKFGDYGPVGNAIHEHTYNLIVSANVAVCVQGFFVYRIWIFSKKNIILPLVFIPCALFELLSTIIYAAKAVSVSTLAEAFALEKIILGSYGVAPIVDLGVSGCMLYYISNRGQSSFHSTTNMLHRLTLISINSGAWTAAFAAVTLILALTTPGSNYYGLANFPLTPLYVNSCFGNLNARSYIRGTNTDSNDTTSNRGGSQAGNVFHLAPIDRNQRLDRETQIVITTEQTKQTDADLAFSGIYNHGHGAGKKL